jgi:hypothetical protein
MSTYQMILTKMKRNEVEAVAKEFNNTYKITGIGKKKKQDLILELLQNEKLLDKVFNRLYPRGEPIQDIVQKVKKPRKKKIVSKEEEKDLNKQIIKLSKEAIKEKSPSGKLKILKEIRKLQRKL